MDITSERIKKRRKSLNMSQDDLAKLCGYKDRSSITKIETSAKNMPIDKIQTFAKALRTNPDYLMGWSDDEFSQVDGFVMKNAGLIMKKETAPEEIPTETVYNYLVRAGYIESGEDLSEADLQFLEAQLSTIALWFKSIKDSRK